MPFENGKNDKALLAQTLLPWPRPLHAENVASAEMIMTNYE
jgi:hypothetical protein